MLRLRGFTNFLKARSGAFSVSCANQRTDMTRIIFKRVHQLTRQSFSYSRQALIDRQDLALDVFHLIQNVHLYADNHSALRALNEPKIRRVRSLQSG